ncbi:phage BR0599 family protein [Serratia marcescens]|uniref:phage BR0599 family protein n=1 Tax=Serratia marcescens TaxID=615 RepID=UPI0007451CCB|nr:phage BR0599 family protein [Serratia marcescens]MBH3230794.1 phage BR0599 family protein [Serratia marcescens]CUZ06653.1 Uncharacterized conserved protein [Serratia marcescens]CUZ36649.1 Uncharacterized conserved protein [Serratia marcescens]CUZ79032.1 Uncharacterized conserved protein [Serratia marcescens]CUZ99998.1 Uncharacterized conserved protein [Serratia marcescens]
MSWSDFEYSTANGQPVTLYEFVRGDTQFFRYTNADQDITAAGAVWQQQAISDGGLSVGAGDGMDITLPTANPVAMLFRGLPPSQPVRVRIHRWHVGDSQGEFRTVWIGTITEVKREAIDRTRLVTASLASTFTRSGLRLTWGRACPYSLYDHNCKVSPAAFGVSGLVISALDGVSITVNLPAGSPDGWFSGGYLEWLADGVTERRGLRAQSGNVLGLFGGSAGLSVGQVVAVFPGCDRTIATCNDKFNNVLNYGGQPHMPGKSPYQIIKLF